MLTKRLPFFSISLAALLSLSLYSYNSAVSAARAYRSTQPRWYAGLSVAYGRTTWDRLINDHDRLVERSAPDKTTDFGTTWGGFMGYQFGEHFALEGTYTRYPNTRIEFYPGHTFYRPLKAFTSRTQAYAFIGKFLLPIANDRMSAFLNAGVGFIHRSDVLMKVTRATPSFGLGLLTNVSRRVMAELGFEYYAGYGKTERKPVNDFVPFLFSVYFRLGYRLV